MDAVTMSIGALTSGVDFLLHDVRVLSSGLKAAWVAMGGWLVLQIIWYRRIRQRAAMPIGAPTAAGVEPEPSRPKRRRLARRRAPANNDGTRWDVEEPSSTPAHAMSSGA